MTTLVNASIPGTEVRTITAQSNKQAQQTRVSHLGCLAVVVPRAAGTVVSNHLPPRCILLLWDGDRAHAGYGSL